MLPSHQRDSAYSEPSQQVQQLLQHHLMLPSHRLDSQHSEPSLLLLLVDHSLALHVRQQAVVLNVKTIVKPMLLPLRLEAPLVLPPLEELAVVALEAVSVVPCARQQRQQAGIEPRMVQKTPY